MPNCRGDTLAESGVYIFFDWSSSMDQCFDDIKEEHREFSFAKTFVMGSLTLADREANLIEQSLEESSYIYSFIHCS